jgi:hypothetical protein
MNSKQQASLQVTIDSLEYESIRRQLHDTRLENAENRKKQTLLNRKSLELETKVKQQAKIIKVLK